MTSRSTGFFTRGGRAFSYFVVGPGGTGGTGVISGNPFSGGGGQVETCFKAHLLRLHLSPYRLLCQQQLAR